jgi:hypothetical protein
VLRCWPTTRQNSRSDARCAPTDPRRRCGDVPGSEVSSCKVLEHYLLQLGFCQSLFEPIVLLLQLGKPLSLLGLHSPVLQSPAVVGRLRHIDDVADVADGLALGDQLLCSFELADDLLGCVPGTIHDGDPDPVGPDEDAHSP